jgi:hypothetical protein
MSSPNDLWHWAFRSTRGRSCRKLSLPKPKGWRQTTMLKLFIKFMKVLVIILEIKRRKPEDES